MVGLQSSIKRDQSHLQLSIDGVTQIVEFHKVRQADIIKLLRTHFGREYLTFSMAMERAYENCNICEHRKVVN